MIRTEIASLNNSTLLPFCTSRNGWRGARQIASTIELPKHVSYTVPFLHVLYTLYTLAITVLFMSADSLSPFFEKKKKRKMHYPSFYWSRIMLLLLFEIDQQGGHSVFPQKYLVRQEERVREQLLHSLGWPFGFWEMVLIDFWMSFPKLELS